jgi:hypothetical protein
MSCSISNDSIIDITIRHDHVSELYDHLYDNKENGGELIIDFQNKTTKKIITTHAGQTDSVDSPDSIFNWHSHPISCYKQEKTVWGWLSGEDIRESIIYGFRGSACHFVPSLEGLYTIQPNPCVITNLMNIENIVNKDDYDNIKIGKMDWGDFLRGFIILSIEIYFRSSHIFRTTEFIKNNENVSPEDFVKFANSFKLSNLFEENEIKECSGIKCNRIHTYEKNKLKNVSFENYVNGYESGTDTAIYLIKKNGDNFVTNKKYITYLNKCILILKNIELGKICGIKNTAFHVENILQVKFYPNFVLYNGIYVKYIDMKYLDKIKFIESGHKKGDVYLCKKSDIKVKMFDTRGNCDHMSLRSHITNVGNNEMLNNQHSHKKRKSFIKISKIRSKGRSKKRRSKKRRSKKRRSIGKTLHKNKLVIYGSENCMYCSIANEKAMKMKKIHNFDYTYKKYKKNVSIKDAITDIRKITGKVNIMSIPVYVLNGSVVKDPYVRF